MHIPPNPLSIIVTILVTDVNLITPCLFVGATKKALKSKIYKANFQSISFLSIVLDHNILDVLGMNDTSFGLQSRKNLD